MLELKGYPPQFSVAIYMYVPIWFLSELTTTLVSKYGKPDTWQAQAIMRLSPIFYGLLICASPGILNMVREWIGFTSDISITPERVIGYGTVSGVFAMTARTLGLHDVAVSMVHRFIPGLSLTKQATTKPKDTPQDPT